jgi:predicted ArsR family transcriptional regulator
MKKTWDDLLKPIEPLGEDEMTLELAAERLGVDRTTAKKKMQELEKTGAVKFVGERKLTNGKVTKYAWKLV